jgi:predicted Zn finger-like uncharacterized protein
MDILCANCGTTYVFDEARITGEKMRFKCSKCGNVFEMRMKVPEAKEEEPQEPEQTVRIDMRPHLERMEAEEERKEEGHRPEESPIVVEGIIGAEEAGLTSAEMPDIEIGEPPARLSMDSRISRRGRGIAWRFAPSILVSALLVAAILFGIYLAGSTLAPDISAIIPHRIQRLFTRTQESSVKNLYLSDVQGFFSRNNAVGHIYVVKGKVENRGAKSCQNIRIKGVLQNKDGSPLMERVIVCGVDIPDKELTTLSEKELQARMTALPPQETGLLQPSRAIPFTLVFMDLPKDIYEYSVSIIGADFTP